jgi:hypothetical protein
MTVSAALRTGAHFVSRNVGLVAVLWAVSLGSALLLAVPLFTALENALQETDAAAGMMYGFDYAWWEEWSEHQSGWRTSFGPTIIGVGTAFDGLSRLLQGEFPARLLAQGDASAPLGAVLGIGVVYWVLQVFLTGGILALLRRPDGRWSGRALLHGAGFYFGRLLRVAVLSLFCAWLVFQIHAPLSRVAHEAARDSVSETLASTWSLLRYAGLGLALLFVHIVASYARIILVLQERSSAVLAWGTSLALCARHPLRIVGHFLSVLLLGVLSFAAWAFVDARWETVGFRSQLVGFVLAQAAVTARLALRIGLLAGQSALCSSLSRGMSHTDQV